MFDWDNKTEIEKVLFFDNFYQNIDVEVVDLSVLVSFLENIFKTSSDAFLKEQALHHLCELVISKNYANPYKALSLIFDIKETDEEFLIVQSIRLLFLFYGHWQQKQEIKTALSKFQNHQSAEVTSEVNFRLGLIELVEIQSSTNTVELLRNINKAERYFKVANSEVENRVDAYFFLCFVALQSSIYKNDYSAFETAYNEMENAVSEKQMYSLDEGDIELEFSIHQLIKYLKYSYDSARRSNTWHYPIKELSVLSDSFLQLEKCSMVDSHYQKFHQHIKTGIVRNCLNTIYQSGLEEKTELFKSINTLSGSSISDDFVIYILNLLQSKDVSIQNDIQLALKLREIITSPKDVEDALKELGQNRDISTVLRVLGAYFKRCKTGLSFFETGYLIGDDVLNYLRTQVAELLPNLEKEKQSIFFTVVAEIIRYAQHSHLGYNKSKFLFLFSKQVKGGLGDDAQESDLQVDLYESLKHGAIAQYFEYEKDKVVSGGRVDIIFKCDIMSVPIEIKKTKESPTKEIIEEYYIAQAQTYTSAYEQLGIFVLLDLSDKGKRPIPNFKDWFNIHHLSTATGMPINHPDYVVSVVIPGNKLLPSMMSTYK
ncbi:MAG TPA: hypothetical protein VIK55_09940 [Paludibacter sp.]